MVTGDEGGSDVFTYSWETKNAGIVSLLCAEVFVKQNGQNVIKNTNQLKPTFLQLLYWYLSGRLCMYTVALNCIKLSTTKLNSQQATQTHFSAVIILVSQWKALYVHYSIKLYQHLNHQTPRVISTLFDTMSCIASSTLARSQGMDCLLHSL